MFVSWCHSWEDIYIYIYTYIQSFPSTQSSDSTVLGGICVRGRGCNARESESAFAASHAQYPPRCPALRRVRVKFSHMWCLVTIMIIILQMIILMILMMNWNDYKSIMIMKITILFLNHRPGSFPLSQGLSARSRIQIHPIVICRDHQWTSWESKKWGRDISG